ncbi:MAG TPA: flagellar biosynthesis protein FlhF [Armatimonadota bacterium]|jgi:flagellar biosynthesis protein FlhF
MKIKRFEADSIQEAMKLVKEEFGRDAVILQTRQFQSKRLLGLKGKDRAEVLAAIDVNVPPRPVTPLRPVAAAVRQPGVKPEEVESLRKEVEDLREAFRGLALSTATRTLENSEGSEALRQHGLPEDVVERTLAEAKGALDIGSLTKALASLLPIAPLPTFEQRPHILALVGPTGSGKTTTIAKLAARYGLGEARRTALITADTYRIGAVGQLRTYAEILKLPMEVAMTPAEVASAVERHSDKELILVDTVGRSQRKPMHLSELEALVKAARPTEVHLTVSAAASLAVQEEVIERFRRVGATRLLVTKLDEAAAAADACTAALRSGLPLSYTTDGQTVPDDLQAADALRLAALVLGAT